MGNLRTIGTRLGALSLSMRFALTGSGVMLAAALIIGFWLTGIISRSVVSNTAGATALFMDSFIGPLAQELEKADTLSIGPTRAIEEMLDGSALGQRVVSVKIWKPDGLIAYAENNRMIGQRFPVSRSLEAALAGSIVSELNELEDDESASERESGLPLLEIYSPVREAWTGKVIAVAEFYEDATELQNTLLRARAQAWLVVLVLTVMIGAALFGIVHRGSRVIDQQRAALHARMDEAERASAQNRMLRKRVERAAGRAAELNERFLRRISADLHDGPAQLIGLAALRLSSLAKARAKSSRLAEMAVVKGALDEAMREIRDICGGLSLPEIENLSLSDIIANVAATHERRTSTAVTLDIQSLPFPAGHQGLKICVFRFVQEGLNNAFHHAAGVDQKVEAFRHGSTLTVRVSNGPSTGSSTGNAGGLGLSGLRERVESLGGSFDFAAAPGKTVTMTMTIDVGAGASDG